MRLAIIGKYGQLAQAVKAYAQIRKFKSISLSRKDFPMQKTLSFDLLNKFKPTHVLIASAYTFVDKAEKEKGLALAINSFSVGQLSVWCIQNDVKLVYPSTDYVFDGVSGKYQFSDQVNPINFYGKTKMVRMFVFSRTFLGKEIGIKSLKGTNNWGRTYFLESSDVKYKY